MEPQVLPQGVHQRRERRLEEPAHKDGGDAHTRVAALVQRLAVRLASICVAKPRDKPLVDIAVEAPVGGRRLQACIHSYLKPEGVSDSAWARTMLSMAMPFRS